MKKIAIALVLVLSLSLFAACGSDAPAASGSDAVASDSAAPAALPENLDDIMDAMYATLSEEEMPALPSAEDLKLQNEQNTGKYLNLNADLDDEMSVYYTGVSRASYVDGIVSEPMMMGVAHRVVILRAESAEAAAQLAKDVEANANPRWNICTEAEKVSVTNIDDVVVLIMSTADMTDKMAAALQALVG